MEAFNTPILFIVFNRPETTQRVFEKIRKAKPPRLYVGADGPRKGNLTDAESCRVTRKIIEQVDWPCSVYTLFNEVNLGCGKAVSNAINWFFEKEEMGIVLEDDCLPDDDFFMFCQVLLLRYKTDERIMHIGGTNFQEGIKRGNASYYFAANVHVWGWASWSRAWRKYSFEINGLDEFIKERKVGYYYAKTSIQSYWNNIFRRMIDHQIDTWDYQWLYTIMNNKGLAIIPQHNLISNIGFGDDATHTQGENKWANVPTHSFTELKHPDKIEQNKEADLYTYQHHYKPHKSIFQTLKSRIKNLIK